MPFLPDKIQFPYLSESVTVRYYTAGGKVYAPVADSPTPTKATAAITTARPQRMREVVFVLERGGKVPELPAELTPLYGEDMVDFDIRLTTPSRDANGSATYKAEGAATFRMLNDTPYEFLFPKSQSFDPGTEPEPPA